MYRAFELVVTEDVLQEAPFRKCANAGKKITLSEEKNIEELLRDVLYNGTIDGTALAERYFPILKRDVFLSYSHKDKELAYMLVGMLESFFGLTTFIDSTFWGNADILLKEIDNKYCLQCNSQSYSYIKRNFSTAHVHVMLMSAIMKAMDSAEIIIFLNTPRSVPDLELAINGNGYDEYTLSPWIYEEILLTTMLKESELNRYRQRLTLDEEVLEHYAKRLNIKYKLPQNKLIQLSLGDIEEWYKEYQMSQDKHPLDVLYTLKSNVAS